MDLKGEQIPKIMEEMKKKENLVALVKDRVINRTNEE
jgi:hypothetical protein